MNSFTFIKNTESVIPVGLTKGLSHFTFRSILNVCVLEASTFQLLCKLNFGPGLAYKLIAVPQNMLEDTPLTFLMESLKLSTFKR